MATSTDLTVPESRKSTLRRMVTSRYTSYGIVGVSLAAVVASFAREVNNEIREPLGSAVEGLHEVHFGLRGNDREVVCPDFTLQPHANTFGGVTSTFVDPTTGKPFEDCLLVEDLRREGPQNVAVQVSSPHHTVVSSDTAHVAVVEGKIEVTVTRATGATTTGATPAIGPASVQGASAATTTRAGSPSLPPGHRFASRATVSVGSQVAGATP